MDSIFVSDAEYEPLLARMEEMMADLDRLPYPKVKDDLHELLQHFDLLHREALTRLFKEIIINYPALKLAMANDKAVSLLFSLYDLFQTDIQNGVAVQAEIGGGSRSSQYPRWIPVGNIHTLKENTTYKYAEDDEDILICKTEGKVYAVKNCCGHTALPLDGAVLAHGVLICPWHGCPYRLSDGVMETNPLQQVKTYPVTIGDEGQIRIGLNM